MMEEKALEDICKATWEPLYRFIYYKVQNREEAEDITQETYSKAIAYIKKNNVQVEKYISYLKTVSLNVIRDRWRKKQRQGTHVDIETVNQQTVALPDPTEALTQRAVLEDALKLLNGEQRTVIELRIIKGYSVAEAAKAMNKKENTLRVIQFRALQKLTQLLKNAELDGGSNHD